MQIEDEGGGERPLLLHERGWELGRRGPFPPSTLLVGFHYTCGGQISTHNMKLYTMRQSPGHRLSPEWHVREEKFY